MLPCLVKKKRSPSPIASKQAISLSFFSSAAMVFRFTAFAPGFVSAMSSTLSVIRLPRLVKSFIRLSVDVSKSHLARSASVFSGSRCRLGTRLSLPSALIATLTSTAAISASFTSITGSAFIISVMRGLEYFSRISPSSPFMTWCSLCGEASMALSSFMVLSMSLCSFSIASSSRLVSLCRRKSKMACA